MKPLFLLMLIAIKAYALTEQELQDAEIEERVKRFETEFAFFNVPAYKKDGALETFINVSHDVIMCIARLMGEHISGANFNEEAKILTLDVSELIKPIANDYYNKCIFFGIINNADRINYFISYEVFNDFRENMLPKMIAGNINKFLEIRSKD